MNDGVDRVFNDAKFEVYRGDRWRVLAMLNQRPELREDDIIVFDSRVNKHVPVAEYLVLNGTEKKREIAALVRSVSTYSERHDEDDNEFFTDRVIERINQILGDI